MTRLELRADRLERDATRRELASVGTFAGKVRKLVLEKGPLRLREIADYLDLGTKRERRRASATLSDLMKAGHIRRLETGVYGPPEIGRGVSRPKQEKRNVMWRVMRAKRVVTVGDLEELAEVSRAYAQEWLRGLVKLEVARALENGKYRLVRDTVSMPVLTENSEKLRVLRARQKAAMKAVGQAQDALNEARNLLAGEV